MLIILLLSVLTGCKNSAGVDPKAIMNDIKMQYADTMTDMRDLEDSADLQTYYYIEPEDVRTFAAAIKTDAADAPVEIVLVEAIDENAAQNVYTALERRYNSIVSQYASYSPEQLSMAQACEVTQNGSFVTMIVAEDYDGMIKLVNNALKG